MKEAPTHHPMKDAQTHHPMKLVSWSVCAIPGRFVQSQGSASPAGSAIPQAQGDPQQAEAPASPQQVVRRPLDVAVGRVERGVHLEAETAISERKSVSDSQ